MKRDWNEIVPWVAARTLLESPGVIYQGELELFDELRDTAEENFRGGHTDTSLSAILESVEASLLARFEDGFLVEMGQLDFSRDRNGNPQVWRGSWAVGLN
jgi:hypothetical protein